MERRTMYITLFALLAASLLLGACRRGPDTGHVGPKGPVGPQGTVGPQGPFGPQGDVGPQGNIGPSSNLGPSSENAILIKGTGAIVESEYPLSAFSEVEVSDFFDAEIRQGDTYRVMVEADEALTPYVDVFVRGKTLHIGLEPNYTYNIEESSHRVEVTLPDLTWVEITDFSDTSIRRFENLGDIEIKVSDFGSLSADIEADSVRVDIREHSNVDLAGVVQGITGNVEELSTLDVSKLNAQEINVVSDQLSEITE